MLKTIPAYGGLLLASLTFGSVLTAQEDRYLPEWGSLARHHEAPEWFRDAKFGIYFHWGVYSVPEFGNEWYPRWMHFEGHKHRRKYDYYTFHMENYGHPSEFGYHDFVPMFKAEHFDADEWALLFQAAGARFAGPVAEHHDGFSMWDSDVTPWNSMDKGPKRDITGELAEAVRKRGMKLVTTFHHARNLQRYSAVAEEEGSREDILLRHRFRHSHYPYLEGTPPASDDPELRLLYGNIPEEEWLDRMWLGKLHEVMDRYQPDMIWFDSWLDQIPEDYRMRFCADYLNKAGEWGKEVVIVRKQDDMPISVSIEDFEKGRMDRLTESCWLTDDTLSMGSWSFTRDLEIKPTKVVLHSLIDIVSKNGCLLLNLSPKADGTIPENQKQVLLEMGQWLQVNGEAIYETRPWSHFGEGPTRLGKGGGFIKEVSYTSEDIRYTRSKDDSVLYAILLGIPEAGDTILLESIDSRFIRVDNIRLLGNEADVKWELVKEGLQLTMPDEVPNDLALVFRIQKTFE
jgi:alpha-L-fucosidase